MTAYDKSTLKNIVYGLKNIVYGLNNCSETPRETFSYILYFCSKMNALM